MVKTHTSSGISTGQDQNSASVNSNAEINKLSGELNSRLSREMDDMMNSVNIQIQSAISDAISNQILPQIQNALKAGSGHLTQNRWNVPVERPELNSEDCRRERMKGNLRSEPVRDCFLTITTNKLTTVEFSIYLMPCRNSSGLRFFWCEA